MTLPELIAHRGHAAVCPENTLAAMRSAVEAGARWVETDVQISRDGVPFLFHDRTLQRLCGVGGSLGEHSAAEIDGLWASERERFGVRFEREPVARLSAFVGWLASTPDVQAFVELKRVSLDRFGIEAVLDAVLPVLGAIESRATLISFSLEALLAARQRSALPVGAVFERWSERLDSRTATLRPEFVFCDIAGLPAEGRLEQRGARLAVYEVARAESARELASRGVEFVETFEIARLGAELAGGAR